MDSSGMQSMECVAVRADVTSERDAHSRCSCGCCLCLLRPRYGMGDFCLLCVSTYVCNFSLLIVVIREVAAKRKESKNANRKMQKKAL